MKNKILIIFQDGRPELERTAKGMGERLAADEREVLVLPAGSVTIPQMLAATFLVFGADEAETESYGEVARLLGGMNLAGRKAAYFGSNGAAIAWLKGLTADSELGQAGADLLGAKPEPSALAAWVRSLS